MGEFKVSVTVTDDNLNPLSATYTFKIIITKTADNSTNSTNSLGVNITIASNTTKIESSKVVKDKVSTSFTAYIKSISIKGMALVMFSSDAFIPANYT